MGAPALKTEVLSIGNISRGPCAATTPPKQSTLVNEIADFCSLTDGPLSGEQSGQRQPRLYGDKEICGGSLFWTYPPPQVTKYWNSALVYPPEASS